MAKLAEIARDMKNEARRRTVSHRDLARGLSITLYWCGGTKTLRLARPVTMPGDDEISICRTLFSVPRDAQEIRGENHVDLRWPS